LSTWTLLFAALALASATGFAVLARRCMAMQKRITELAAELDGAHGQLEIFTGAIPDELQAPLRELHRVGQQVMTVETVEMATLAHEVASELAARYPKSTVNVADLPPVRGDRALLKLAWTHLLDNALKFSASAQAPRVDIGARSHDREIEFWIRDNGTGFDMAHRHRLFEVFQRLHQADEFAGTGTGLAMVRLVAARHGGNVRAQAQPGEGASFTMLLPNANMGSPR
jgi:light-regulated signal transduction histidine kinase (bacteriophytochrome)